MRTVAVEPETAPAGPPLETGRTRKQPLLFCLTAVLISIPCLWQTHIQADDLSSHLYNAWLVSEVQTGKLPGLYVVQQFTNVLFDHLLSLLLKTGSVLLTEKVAVLIAVQIFFWGGFTLVSAIAGRRAWSVAPFLALIAYGAVFRLGFFNFYIGVGICAFAIALVWQDHPRPRWLAIPLLALAYTAHSLPCLWAIGVIGYIIVERRLRPSLRRWLTAAGLLAFAAAAFYLAKEVPSRWAPGLRIDSLFGTDQMLTFGPKYKFVAAGLLCLWILILVQRFERRRSWQDAVVQLWVLSVALCLLMPDAIWLPIYTAGLAFITVRLSLLCSLFFCAVIASVRLSLLERVASYALLAVFFSFSYVDERALNGIESNVAKAVATLPAGARVISTLRDKSLYVQALEHIVDRPCIGRCYDFGNYEPSTAQFRLRARPGNSFVLANYGDIGDLEHNWLIFRRGETDVYRVVPCGENQQICAEVLKPGELLVEEPIASAPRWIGGPR